MELPEALRVANDLAKSYQRAAEVLEAAIQAEQALGSLQKAKETAQSELTAIQEQVKQDEAKHQELLQVMSQGAAEAQNAIQAATAQAKEGLAQVQKAWAAARSEFDLWVQEHKALVAAEREELAAVQNQVEEEQVRLSVIKGEIGALKARLE